MSNSDNRVFDGFPYIATRLVGAYLHLILLPKGFAFGDLFEVTRRQADFNRLPTCLVLDTEKCVYFLPDATEKLSTHIPQATFLTSGKIRHCVSWPVSEDLMERVTSLEALDRDIPTNAVLFGDFNKGGRTATDDELIRLSGFQKNGVPKGLIQCPFCHEWKGLCIDPNPHLKNLLVQVRCLCENDNLCAWCWDYLYDRKLNGNYYNGKNGQVIHVAGFAALSHRCPAKLDS